MKKFLFFTFSFVFLLITLLGCFAAEGEASATVNPTLTSRLWEFVCANKQSVLTLVGNVVLLVFYVISALLGKKKSNLIEKGVNNIIQGTTDVKGNQDAMVSAVNGLIDGYNAMGQKYEQYGKFEGARDKYAVAAVTQSTAILEILYTVYANSKNVPQGVKDLVNLKYASCLKQIGDDKELMAIVESIRHIIGGSDEPSEEEEKTE